MTLIKSTDARRAVEIAKTTIPCAGALKETFEAEGSKPQTAMCVMGCLYQAVAERRKQSFAVIRKQIGDNGGETEIAANLDERLNLGGNIVDINDDQIALEIDTLLFDEDFKVSENKALIKEARSLQVKLLTNLAKKLEKYENQTGKFFSVGK